MRMMSNYKPRQERSRDGARATAASQPSQSQALNASTNPLPSQSRPSRAESAIVIGTLKDPRRQHPQFRGKLRHTLEASYQPQEPRRLHYRRSLRARRTPRPIRTVPESQLRIRSGTGFSENHAAIALPATATNMLIGTPVT